MPGEFQDPEKDEKNESSPDRSEPDEEEPSKETMVLLAEIHSPEAAELGRLLAVVREWHQRESTNERAQAALDRALMAHGHALLNAQSDSEGRFTDEQKVGWREAAVEDILFIKNLLPESLL